MVRLRQQLGVVGAVIRIITTTLIAAWSIVVDASDISLPSDPLIEARWLDEHLQRAGLKVVDLRTPAAYGSAHVGGAVNIPIDALFETSDHRQKVATVAVIQEALSAAGISNSDVVVLYDDGTLNDAGRAYWVFELYGHRGILLLNGGFAAWEVNRYAISDVPATPTRTAYVPSIQSRRLATKLATRLAVDSPNAVIVDARNEREYRGEETRTGIYGRIAHAVNLPAAHTFETRDGVIYAKALPEIRAMYSSVPRSKQVVTYCNTGRKSAMTYFNFRRLGYDVSNYDGSWTEWGADPSLPAEARSVVPTSDDR